MDKPSQQTIHSKNRGMAVFTVEDRQHHKLNKNVDKEALFSQHLSELNKLTLQNSKMKPNKMQKKQTKIAKVNKLKIIGVKSAEMKFKVMRSDGKVEILPNSQMKNLYPHQLIRFYESQIKWT